MSAYGEWIKLGQDPIYNHEYYALPRAEAEKLAGRFTEVTPDRVRQLNALMAERRLEWKPDFTEEAFVALGEAFTGLVETRPRTQHEIEADLTRQRQEQPEVLALLGDSVRDWEPTNRSYSIAFDAGLYFAQDLMTKEPRFEWRVENRRNANWNHPVLAARRAGRKAPMVIGSPIDVFHTELFSVGSGRPFHRVPWSIVYQEWMKYLAWYLSENPREV